MISFPPDHPIQSLSKLAALDSGWTPDSYLLCPSSDRRRTGQCTWGTPPSPDIRTPGTPEDSGNAAAGISGRPSAGRPSTDRPPVDRPAVGQPPGATTIGATTIGATTIGGPAAGPAAVPLRQQVELGRVQRRLGRQVVGVL